MSSLTMVLVLLVQAVAAILMIAGTTDADSVGKSLDLESPLDEIYQRDDDDNAVVIEGEVICGHYSFFCLI